jgi:hypothetical protein
MKTIFNTIGILTMILLVALTGCKRSDQYAKLNIRLTDAPGQYEHVFIDVQGIEIHTSLDGWFSPAHFNAGVYDLLQFNNGTDTLLCSFDLPAGKITQIRLFLGNNNSVVVDSVTYPLITPSAQQSGLKINLQENLLADVSYTIILDFDAGKSIVRHGNGSYSLKPVIRAYSDLNNGKIKGIVSPMTAQPVVYAIQGTDSISAIPNPDGFFMICGLNGLYNLLIQPANPAHVAITISGVQTSWGTITDVGTINLP